jgi:HNH endonuclease
MPTRTKRQPMTPEVRQQILAIYEETMSVRETGRRVNMHENSVRLVLKASKGQCSDCPTPILLGRRYCPDCAARRTAWMRERRKERRRLGLCETCDERIQPPSTQFCDVHRFQHAQRSRVHVDKMARGTPEAQQREKHLRHRFGYAGVEVWNRDQGTCVLCKGAAPERKIHVHHIDGDTSNNVAKNLVCLCSRCHRLIHSLVEHASPHTVIQWFLDHYPYALLSQALRRSSGRIRRHEPAEEPSLTFDFVGA